MHSLVPPEINFQPQLVSEFTGFLVAINQYLCQEFKSAIQKFREKLQTPETMHHVLFLQFHFQVSLAHWSECVRYHLGHLHLITQGHWENLHLHKGYRSFQTADFNKNGYSMPTKNSESAMDKDQKLLPIASCTEDKQPGLSKKETHNACKVGPIKTSSKKSG